MSKVIEFFRKGRLLIPLEKRNKTMIYVMVILATSLDNLNVSGTLTSIFSISESFEATTTTISWVFAAYSLTLGSFIIIAGKLADVVGPHRVFLTGLFFLSIFALISAVIVKEVVALIVFRAFQGMFAASLIPSAFALTANYFKGEALFRAITGLIMSLTTVFGVGCILGGAFSESAVGYKGLYYFTFSVGMSMFICLYFLIIPIEKTEGHKNLHVKNLDFGGCFAMVAGLLLVILGLTEGGHNWNSPSAYVPLAIGILVILSVVGFEMIYIQKFKDHVDSQITHNGEKDYEKQEIKGRDDWRYKIQLLFPREVLKIRNFFNYLISTFLFYINYISIMSTLIHYHQYVTLDSPIMVAVKVLPMALGLAFGASIYRERIAKKIGHKIVICISPVIVLTMSVWLSRLDFRIKNSYWKYECFAEFFLGYGTNLYFQVYFNDIITGTPKHLQGSVSGILQTSGQIGVCFGNTIIASLVGDITYSKDYNDRLKLHDKFKKNFYLAFAASGALLIVLLTTRPKPKEPEPAPTKDEEEAPKETASS